MQGTFDFCQDLPDRPKRPERLFFGLFPDAATSRRLTEFGEHFADDNHLSGTRLKSERLHVSLHRIGDFGRLKSKFVHAARQAGNAVSQPPFEVTFRFIESFSPPPIVGRIRRRPLVLRGEGRALFELHSTLGAAMRECGLNAAEDFVPHMTLLYGSKAVPLQAIEPIRFVAREFILIHSELGLTRYTALGRWALESKATAARGAPASWRCNRAFSSI